MTPVGKFEQLLINLGKDNKPTYVAMGVATAKGIFRPIFTMSDKKQDKEVKKYTAIREGLTELIAIPVYWGSGAIAEMVSKKIAKPKDMAKDMYKRILDNETFIDKEQALIAKNVKKSMFKMRTTLSMLGVFLSALLVIPAICSATIKPLMKAMQKGKNNSPNKNPEIAPVTEPAFKGYPINYVKSVQCYKNHYSGMRIGGL